jgi:hypothetical protein
VDQYDSRAEDSGNGESLGFALRLGSPIGAKWGVEAEFVRPGEITSNQVPQIFPATLELTAVQGIPGLPNQGLYDPLIFPPISYEFRSTQRRSTLSTSLWVRQEISSRVSMVYLGGVAFGRTSNEVEITYTFPRQTILPLPPISPLINESISYDVQPMVGRRRDGIRMGGKVDLVPAATPRCPGRLVDSARGRSLLELLNRASGAASGAPYTTLVSIPLRLNASRVVTGSINRNATTAPTATEGSTIASGACSSPMRMPPAISVAANSQSAMRIHRLDRWCTHSSSPGIEV